MNPELKKNLLIFTCAYFPITLLTIAIGWWIFATWIAIPPSLPISPGSVLT